MALQQALNFIHVLKSRSADTGRNDNDLPDIGAISEVGKNEGFQFTIEELRQAHRFDWQMRLSAKLSQDD